MTIGPLPMIRIESMSVRRGTSAAPGHDRGELFEQVGRVVRTGAGLGVMLDREHRLAPEPQPSHTPSLRLTWVISTSRPSASGSTA